MRRKFARAMSVAALLVSGACANSTDSTPVTAGAGSGGAPVSVAGNGAGLNVHAGGSAIGQGGTSAGGAPATTSFSGAGMGGMGLGATTSTTSPGGSGGGGGALGIGGSAGVAGGATTCAGTPIVPDGGGFVAPGSNPLGIHGSWFVYSDCVDLHGVNCATVTTPMANTFPNIGGKICTSGSTSTGAGAWGAGIALELNDGPPQQPYDTTAHGVKGFCFVVSGAKIPTTTIRVAFPTKDNPDNAYFAPVSTPGEHTVLFADTAQGSWVTTKAAFEPTKVMLLQFQIPSSTTAPVPWDFCIEGLTAIAN